MENVFDMQMGVSAGEEDMFQEEGEIREDVEQMLTMSHLS